MSIIRPPRFEAQTINHSALKRLHQAIDDQRHKSMFPPSAVTTEQTTRGGTQLYLNLI